jgi:hypothetical protein
MDDRKSNGQAAESRRVGVEKSQRGSRGEIPTGFSLKAQGCDTAGARHLCRFRGTISLYACLCALCLLLFT